MSAADLPDAVMLADFERFLDFGLPATLSDRDVLLELIGLVTFLEDNGRRLLDLARKGTP